MKGAKIAAALMMIVGGSSVAMSQTTSMTATETANILRIAVVGDPPAKKNTVPDCKQGEVSKVICKCRISFNHRICSVGQTCIIDGQLPVCA